MNYIHKEAFCLMRYRSDDFLEEEFIWNSRDGVTPYIITLRSGKQATHVDWHMDNPQPKRICLVGDRIFVDLTRKEAKKIAKRMLARYGKTVSKQEMGHIVDSIYADGRNPSIYVVQEGDEWTKRR